MSGLSTPLATGVFE
ncbi:Hypothetical protein SSCIU_02507 [Mammaliicoccus sciuri]|nr:Hypothetical protein SSCIU_02507 [Mammaliicoccus sciuri]